MLQTESLLFIGGLVPMSELSRTQYLDNLLNSSVRARLHLLGMMRNEWFAPYSAAVQGDNTSWIPRSEWNRRKTPAEWMLEYGEQWVPHQPHKTVQLTLF
ncbi:hypothetical protein [Paenibacillus riograndensis]|nr:hypothetical protein [Paenibacillus riograndensis]